MFKEKPGIFLGKSENRALINNDGKCERNGPDRRTCFDILDSISVSKTAWRTKRITNYYKQKERKFDYDFFFQ